MKQIKVCIKTISPIVLTSKNNTTIMTGTNDYFSGSIVRGIISKEYIRLNDLGKCAHENNDFVELFLNKLRFTDANLVDIATGKRSFKLPLSLQKNKEGTDIIDLLNPATEFPGAGYKTIKKFGVITDDNQIKTVEVKKNMSIHISRCSINEGKKSERLAGKSIDGGIYNYESINPNQVFISYIYGDELYLNKLINKFSSSWQIFAGRSSSTQYGKCIMTLGDIEDIPKEGMFSISDGNNGDLHVRLDSNMLNASGIFYDAQTVLSQLISRLNSISDSKFEICSNNGRFFTNTTNIDGFVNVWGMKRPREEALSAGSIFTLHKDGEWIEEEINFLNNVLYDGVGIRCEEGFGQLRPWSIEKTLTLYNKKDSNYDDSIEDRHELSNIHVIRKAREIISLRILEMVRMIASTDAEESVKKNVMPDGSAQFLQRLDDMLTDRKHASWKKMSDALRGEIGDTAQVVFNDRLNTIRIFSDMDIKPRGYSLKNIFIEGEIKYPYIQTLKCEAELSGIIDAMKYLSINDDIFESNEIFYEYWHWYFRHCRKLVSRKNGD